MYSPLKPKLTANRFFSAIPETNKHIELFDGEIKCFRSKDVLHHNINDEIWYNIRMFIKSKRNDCEILILPFDVKLDDYNVVQPDILVVCDLEKLKDGKRCNGAPDLVIEVVSDNRKYDYIDKLELYCRSKVREYWIVDSKYKIVSVYKFEEADTPCIYTFDQDIPVGIFADELNINIGELVQ